MGALFVAVAFVATTILLPVDATASTPSGLTPVGTPILTDAAAAALVNHSSWEPRPANSDENSTVPTQSQLNNFYGYTGQWGSCDNLRRKVTGNFRGTTDEIIQWASWKWGLPENVTRAAAVNESWWKMSTVGDGGESFGLLQIRNRNEWHGGTYPMSKTSTAFNVDYWAGMIRHYYEGCAGWMKNYTYNQTKYAAGDFWGAVGAWYSGVWHSDAANRYIRQVKRHKRERTWRKSSF